MSFCEDKRRMLEVTWYTAATVSVAYVIAALVVSTRLSKSDSPASTQPTAFAAVWSMLLLLAILVGGTVVFKRIQTPIATGVLLGCTAMFSQIELMLFTIFAARSRDDYASAGEKSAAGAVAAFSFFLFIIMGLFSAFLCLWRQHLPAAAGPSSMDSYA